MRDPIRDWPSGSGNGAVGNVAGPEAPVEPPKDYVTAKERLAEQDWAGVADKGLAKLGKAETGWVLGLVLMFALMVGGTALVFQTWVQSEEKRDQALVSWLLILEENRAKAEEHRADELRRCQESIRYMADALGRHAEVEK